jgi:glycosyltransferase involved in cell wall biosynthesis
MSQTPNLIALCPQTPHHRQGGGGPVRAYFILDALARIHPVTLALLDTGVEVPATLAARCTCVLVPLAQWGASPSLSQRPVGTWRRIAGIYFGDGPALLAAGELNCVTRAEGDTEESRSAARRLGHALFAWSLLGAIALRGAFFRLRPARGSERVGFYRSLLAPIARAHQERPFTHVWVEHSYLIPEALDLASRLGGLRIIINAHNVETVLHQRLAGLMRSTRTRAWYCGQARQLGQVEAEGFRRAERVLCCSAEDARFIRDLAPGARIEVVPNGVDTDYMRPAETVAARPTVVFLGSFGYFPNIDAVGWFHAEVLPLIWQEAPDCQFCIVGYGADRFASLAARDPRIEIAANVPDVRPYLARAWVVVVPLRSGSGTRLKILDAMAMAKPVVSTRVGAEGIDIEARSAGYLAEDAKELACKTLLLLKDRKLRQDIGRKGRSYAEEVFSWTVIGAMVTLIARQIGMAPRTEGCATTAPGHPPVWD